MALARLDIRAVRNLAEISLVDLQPANIFFGENGGGKTSVLESVFLLAMARSFRSAQIKPVISHGSEQCVVFGELQVKGHKTGIGVRRDRSGGFEAKVGGNTISSTAELAERLPVQVINAQSFELLTGSPIDRRRYLDWGVFHVEHRYHETWRRFQRCIKQRNSLLRHGKISESELTGWSREFIETGEQIDGMRRDYLDALLPAFSGLLERLSPSLSGTEIRYRRGWEVGTGLHEALQGCQKSDREQGFTHVGPQRADLKILLEGHDAGDTLSRGQQKLVVCALKLAQGQVLGGRRGTSCIYLVDDLPSELDAEHCRRVCEVLAEMNAQVFLTSVEKDDIAKHWPTRPGMFHVEHGVIKRVA